MVMTHLGSDPKRRRAVGSSGIWFSSVRQEKQKYLVVSILGGYKKWRSPVLKFSNEFSKRFMFSFKLNLDAHIYLITFMWVLMFAPLFTNSFATPMCPHWQATKSGVPPSWNQNIYFRSKLYIVIIVLKHIYLIPF